MNFKHLIRLIFGFSSLMIISTVAYNYRLLGSGDFAELNEILKGALLKLGDTTVADGFLLTVTLTDLRCTNFSISDVQVASRRIDFQSVYLDIDVDGLDMICYMSYSYTNFLFFQGSGQAEVISLNNDASTTTLLESSNLNDSPPTLASLKSCIADVKISDLQFLNGGILSLVPVEVLLERAVQSQANRAVCKALSDFSEGGLVSLLGDFKDIFDNYPANFEIDALAPEKKLVVPDSVNLLNLSINNHGNDVIQLIEIVLEEGVKFLTKEVEDLDGVTTNGIDFRVNVLLRDFLLDNDRSLTLNVSDFTFAGNGVLWENEDKLTKTKITLNGVKVLGMDTLTKFQPLKTIGNYTVQNELSWEYIFFELDATIDIKPSRAPDSIIVSTENTTVMEQVTIRFGVENLDATASFLLAIEQDILAGLQLGSLIDSDYLIPCIFSSLFELNTSSFSVTVSNVKEPTLDNFLSPGLDRLITGSALAAFKLYEPILLRSAPAFFQVVVRNAINKKLQEHIEKYRTLSCQKIGENADLGNYIDLRDLIMDPKASSMAGGSGTEPYGDILHTLWSDLNDRFLSSGDDGLPKINSLIRPITAAQSGIEGEVNISDAFSFVLENTTSFTSLVESARLQSTGIVISNLDTMAEPLHLLSVVGAQELKNSFHLGRMPDRPLAVETDLVFQINGVNSPLAIKNALKVTIMLKNAINIDMNMAVMQSEFLKFKFKDLLNEHCWYYILPPPDIDMQGNLIDPSSYKGFKLKKLKMAIDELDFDIKCTSCTSAGGQALPEILSTLKASGGGVDTIREDLETFLNEIILRYWNSFDIYGKINKARKLCPSSPYYDPKVDATTELQKLPYLSLENFESIVFLGGLTMNSLIVLTAKSHLLSPTKPTNPLSGQNTLEPPLDGQLIDFSDLSSSLGDWADSAIREASSAFSEIVIDAQTTEVDLGANALVREWLKDGILTININSFKINNDNVELMIREMRIIGLDSFKKANILDVIGTQTISNIFSLERLRVEIVLAIKIEESYELATLSIELGDVDVDMSMLLALDWKELGTMQVGSVLVLRKLLPCLIAKFHAIDITQLLVRANRFYEPYLVGFLSEDRHELLRNSTEQFFEVFSDDIIAAIPKMWDGTVREVLNHILTDYLTQEEKYCSYITNVQANGIVDFRDMLLSEKDSKALGGSGNSPYGDSLRLSFRALQESLSRIDEKNQSSLNEIFVQPLTREQSNENGTLIFPGEVLNFTGNVSLANWDIEVIARISDVKIDNLDTIGHPLEILQPVDDEPSVLSNTISMGIGQDPLRLAATFFLSMTDKKEMNITNEIEVVLDINTLTIALSLHLVMSEKYLFALPLNHLQQLDCWLSSVLPESFEFNSELQSRFQYEVSAEKAKLNISCVNCGSPHFDDLIEQLYNPGESSEEVDKFVAEAQDAVDNFLGSDFLQILTRKIVADASITCPASPDYNPNATGTGNFWVEPETYLGFKPSVRDKSMKLFNFLMGIIALFFIIGALIGQWVLRKNNQIWLENLPEDQADLLRLQDKNEDAKKQFLNEFTTSMYESVYIPREIRYGVPIAIILNIGLYFGAHFGVLCYLNIESQVAGDQFTVENFLDFRFFDAALRTYNNGGNEMAVFLITFSGIWPYIKLLGALILWFMPPSKLPVAHREKILLWMDALTKLSIIDIVTLLVGVAALLVYLGGPGEEFYNSGDLYGMTLVVVPRGGFYCIMIAQRMNRVSSRFFLDYHHMIVLSALKEYRKRNQIRLSNENSVSRSWGDTETLQNFHQNPSFEITRHGSVSFPQSRHQKTTKSVMLVRKRSCESVSSFPSHAVQQENKFLISDQDHNMDTASSIFRDELSQSAESARCYLCRNILGGTLGVILAGFTILIVFIIGCILAPSGSLDVKEVLSLGLESGRTYADAVNDFNVFRMISLVFLKARFVLSSTSDYVGLGILLFLAVITIILFPIIQGWQKLKEWQKISRENLERNKKSIIPGFTNRLKVYHHMEVYIISFCIANWQLGAVVAYALHNYCFLLQRFYESLAYVGLVERTDSNCFRRQAADPLTFIISVGSFLILLASFIIQMLAQYKKNKEHAGEFLEEVKGVYNNDSVESMEPFDIIVKKRFVPSSIEEEKV